MNRLVLPLLLLSITTPAFLRAAEATEPATEQAVPEKTVDKSERLRAQELSDDFLGDVADGSSPAANGTVAEEESGDTMDQTLRVHPRLTP